MGTFLLPSHAVSASSNHGTYRCLHNRRTKQLPRRKLVSRCQCHGFPMLQRRRRLLRRAERGTNKDKADRHSRPLAHNTHIFLIFANKPNQHNEHLFGATLTLIEPNRHSDDNSIPRPLQRRQNRYRRRRRSRRACDRRTPRRDIHDAPTIQRGAIEEGSRVAKSGRGKEQDASVHAWSTAGSARLYPGVPATWQFGLGEVSVYSVKIGGADCVEHGSPGKRTRFKKECRWL